MEHIKNYYKEMTNISAFPFTSTQQTRLSQKGFRTIDELTRLTLTQLAEG
jgi:hypothetical protein